MVNPQIGQSDGRSLGKNPALDGPALGDLLDDFLPASLDLLVRAFFCSFLERFNITLGTVETSSVFLSLLLGFPLVFAILNKGLVFEAAVAEYADPKYPRGTSSQGTGPATGHKESAPSACGLHYCKHHDKP